MSRRVGQALLAAALLVAALPVAAAEEEAMQWWGPTTVGQGHHLRVPVTVANGHPFSMSNPVARAELDLGAALAEAGWVTAPSGDEDVLQSFDLDLDSVRVVAMHNHKPPRPGTLDGQMRKVDDSMPSSDLRQYEAPSLVLPGFLEREERAPFNARTNPTVTVLWEVAGTMRPGDERHFVVYFDTVGNRDHAPVSHEGRPGWARLQGLYGPGPALAAVGMPVRNAQGINSVSVIGLEAGTEVRVLTAAPGRPWQLVDPPSGFPSNPTVLGANQARTLFAGTAAGLMVRVEASKPVLSYGVGAGFVPSLDAGMAGKAFLFAKTQPTNDDTIHFIAMGTQPTTVAVRPVPPNGQTFMFQMNGGGAPLPYTIGDRTALQVQPQSPCTVQNPRTLLPGPGLYSAQVVTGDPVMLQNQPNQQGLFAVPAADGSPAGSRHWSAGGWSSWNVQNGPSGQFCVPASINGNWYAASWTDGVRANITSPETTVQVDPAGTPGSPFPPARPLPAFPGVAGRFPTNFRDRPLLFSSSGGDVTLYAGRDPAATGQRVPPIVGPLPGDDAGRRFATLGPTLVYAPHPNTEVTATMQLSQSGIVTQTVRLAEGAIASFGDRSASDWLYSLRLESTKPVLASPAQSPSSTLAAVPIFLEAKPLEAEFRGHLVRLASPSSLDPVTASTSVGVPAVYEAEVTNLGRRPGGANLPDTIDLSLMPLPAGWSAQLDRTAVSLDSLESQTVRLTVTPRPDVAAGSLGVVTLVATSRGNPAMQDTLGTVTYLQRSYDVGLWFGDASSTTGAKNLARGVPPDGTTYPLVAQNQGSVPDVLRIETTAGAPGWSVQVLREGRPAAELSLAAGERAPLSLRVVPPAGTQDGLLVTTVTARSVASPAALDRVTATSRVRTPSDLELEAPIEQAYVRPGEEAAFPLLLHNRGGATEVKLQAALDALPGWTLTGVYYSDPLTGKRINLTTYSIGSRETFPFAVGVRAPASALAGDTLGLRLVARAADIVAAPEAFLYANTAPLHDLRVTLPSLPIESPSGFNGTGIPVRVENRGNLDERIEWHPRDLPAGWRLEGAASLLVPRGATQAMLFNLTVPGGHPPGRYNLTLDLVSEDGNLTSLALGVVLDARGAIASAAASPATLPAQPGVAVELRYPVRNDGNVPLEVRVEPHPSEPWTLHAGATSVVLLQPLENGTVTVSWVVPKNTPEGISSHQARLVLAPQGGPPASREVRAAVDVGRPDLALDGFRSYQGPGGTVLEGRVANHGNRPAPVFVVRLLDGETLLEDLEVRGLPAGSNATVRLLLAAGSSPVVVADPEGELVERDEANNFMAPEVRSSPQDAPAAGGLLLALALLVTAWAGRRR